MPLTKPTHGPQPAAGFQEQCDPFGTNPNGGQVFALHPDGTGLRQLTNSRGLVTEADGTVTNQLPGPWDYGPYAR